MNTRHDGPWSLDTYLSSLTHYRLGSAEAWAIDSPEYSEFPSVVVAWLRMVVPDSIIMSDDPDVPEAYYTADEEFRAWIAPRLPEGLLLDDGEVLEELESGAGGWMTSSWWKWTARAFTETLAIVTWWWDDSDPMGLLYPVGFASRGSLDVSMKLLLVHGLYPFSYIPEGSFKDSLIGEFEEVEGLIVTRPSEPD